MKKKKHKGKKTLTAVGAVVAAGLTPGIIAASPIQNPNAEITAADVVAIDGSTFSFDELYAMQQPSNGRAGEQPQHATRYGAPCTQQPQATHYGGPRPRPRPVTPNPEEIRQKKIAFSLDTIQWGLLDYCAELIGADYYGIMISLDSDLTRELGMDEYELKALKAEIEERYGVEVSYPRFYLIGQLNTLRLISEYICKIKHLWD